MKSERFAPDPDTHLYIGDCREVLPELQIESARGVDLIFADPPYNQGIDYGNGHKSDKRSARDYLDWCYHWIGDCVDVLTSGGSMWVMVPHEWQAAIFGYMHQWGLHWRNTIIWNETFGVNCTMKFSRCSRMIHYFTKDERSFIFNADAIRIPSDRQKKYNDRRANPKGKVPGDVWTFPRVCGTYKERIPGFPTQLPLALLERIVLCASNPGDLVLDPFCGSGTTSTVARTLDRRSITIEVSPQSAESAWDRIVNVGSVQVTGNTATLWGAV